MDTRKFEYLETIRAAIEQGDYDELREYVEDIRDATKSDLDFQELFQEVDSGRYKDVINLIDDIIYKEMQADFDDLMGNGKDDEEEGPDEGGNGFDLGFDKQIKEDISFGPFDEEGYIEKSDEDLY